MAVPFVVGLDALQNDADDGVLVQGPYQGDGAEIYTQLPGEKVYEYLNRISRIPSVVENLPVLTSQMVMLPENHVSFDSGKTLYDMVTSSREGVCASLLIISHMRAEGKNMTNDEDFRNFGEEHADVFRPYDMNTEGSRPSERLAMAVSVWSGGFQSSTRKVSAFTESCGIPEAIQKDWIDAVLVKGCTAQWFSDAMEIHHFASKEGVTAFLRQFPDVWYRWLNDGHSHRGSAGPNRVKAFYRVSGIVPPKYFNLWYFAPPCGSFPAWIVSFFDSSFGALKLEGNTMVLALMKVARVKGGKDSNDALKCLLKDVCEVLTALTEKECKESGGLMAVTVQSQEARRVLAQRFREGAAFFVGPGSWASMRDCISSLDRTSIVFDPDRCTAAAVDHYVQSFGSLTSDLPNLFSDDEEERDIGVLQARLDECITRVVSADSDFLTKENWLRFPKDEILSISEAWKEWTYPAVREGDNLAAIKKILLSHPSGTVDLTFDGDDYKEHDIANHTDVNPLSRGVQRLMNIGNM